MPFDWEELVRRNLGPAYGNQAYFADMVKDVRDYLGNNATQNEIVDCTTKLITELILNEWIIVYDISGDQIVPMNLPCESMKSYILYEWEKIGWRDPLEWEIIWYELSSKGVNFWDGL